ncbi:hypothetical protein GCM10020331_098360 [Ectobacillus funiculus]
MERYGRTPITYEILEAFDRPSQQEVMSKILDEQPEVDGIFFASSDLFAAAFMAEAKKRGKDIPKTNKSCRL